VKSKTDLKVARQSAHDLELSRLFEDPVELRSDEFEDK